MKRLLSVVFVIGFLFVCGCGCGKEATKAGILVGDDSSITETTLYKREDEITKKSLQESLEETIKEYYISSHGNRVDIEEIKKEKENFVVLLQFGTSEVYNGFYERDLFAGSIYDALKVEDNTYFYEVQFLDAKKQEEVVVMDVIGDSSKRVVIFQDDILYHVEGKILYISDNVELLDKKSACLKEGAKGPGYIIY